MYILIYIYLKVFNNKKRLPLLQVCCKGGADHLLLCESCDRGFHTYCCTPPLDKIPEYVWFCMGCVADNIPDDMCNVCSSKVCYLFDCSCVYLLFFFLFLWLFDCFLLACLFLSLFGWTYFLSFFTFFFIFLWFCLFYFAI